MPPPASAIRPKPIDGPAPLANNGSVGNLNASGYTPTVDPQQHAVGDCRIQGVDAVAAPKIKVTRNGIQRNDALIDGVNLDDLELGRLLGAGATGEVFQYRHKVSKKRYAVKHVRLANQSKEEAKKIILAEVAMGLAVQSNYAVKLENAFLRDSTLFIIMEYMDYGSLEDYLRKCPKLSEPAGAFVAKQLLLGLADLHRRHDVGAAPPEVAGAASPGPPPPAGAAAGQQRRAFVHRDLKPANIMVNRKGAVKLADFGGAGAADSMGLATVVGTQTYMAPERIGGKMYSTPSDIWSLGVIVAQLLLGRYPFSGGTENYFELLNAVSNFQGLLLEPSHTAEAQDFINHCLKQDAEQRASAEDLLRHPWIMRHGDAGSECFRAVMVGAEGEAAQGGGISRQTSAFSTSSDPSSTTPVAAYHQQQANDNKGGAATSLRGANVEFSPMGGAGSSQTSSPQTPFTPA